MSASETGSPEPGERRGSAATRGPAPGTPAAMCSLLASGRMRVLGRVPWASNLALLTRVEGDDTAPALAVYKPERGEQPLWDFPPGLHRRERAAYLVSTAFGWDMVPPTVVRDGPLGPGSVQLFVESRQDVNAFDLLREGHEAMPRVALFDAVINNADRKAGHVLLGTGGKVWSIDHGVTFHTEPKLRTVVWEFAGSQVAPELLGALRRLVALLEGPLGITLRDLLNPAELDALGVRCRTLVEDGRFPEPALERPFPWPLL